MKRVLPSYQDDCLVNLMVSIAGALGENPVQREPYAELAGLPAEALAQKPRTVLLVIDGLGYRRLLDFEGDSYLRRHLRASVLSVFPSTTASAVTTLFTGVAPLKHGLTGWHLWSDALARMVTPLPFRDRLSGKELAIDPRSLFTATPFSNRLQLPCYVVLPDYIAESAYSRFHSGRAKRVAFRGLERLFEAVEDILRVSGPAYIHAYWPDFDAISHRHGTWSEAAESHLAEIDAAFGQFVARCAGYEANVIVTADHGFVDPAPASRLSMADHPELAGMLRIPLCGEPRVAYCYPKAGAESEFADYVDQRLGRAFERVSARSAIAQSYFGLGEGPVEFSSRIGAQLLVAKSDFIIGDGLTEKDVSRTLRGFHGGVSEAEMLVPLVLATL